MDKVVLLAELRALAAAPPDFSAYTPTSRPHHEWLAKGDALLSRWNSIEVIPFRSAISYLPIDMLRGAQVGTLLSVLHRAIADLELDVPASTTHAFGPGAVYDFLRELRAVLGSATSSLLIVDPYLDDKGI